MISALKFRVGLLAVFAVAGLAAACDTPVYRYAMYRWEPTPFELYYFHNGQDEQTGEAAKIEELIDEAYHRIEDPANVQYFGVDLQADPELKTVPLDVRKRWQSQDDPQTPSYLLVNPRGTEVFAGPLTEADVKSMLDSPLRKKLGQELAKGHAGVYVFVPGKDDELNKTAKAEVKKLVDAINAGELDLYRSPEDDAPRSSLAPPPDEEEEPDEAAEGDIEADDAPAEGASLRDEDEPAEKPPHTAAMLTIPGMSQKGAEQWLVRSLMAVEADLYEIQEEDGDPPMVFVVYGRGRALPPYIGKGITYENLVDVTYFVTGACSCTVKDQNPGVDLLMAYDWEAASAAVADRFGVEEGNEQEELADLFPQILIPSVGPVDETSEGGSEEPPEVASTNTNEDDPPQPKDPPSDQTANTNDNTPDAPVAPVVPADAEPDGQPAENIEVAKDDPVEADPDKPANTEVQAKNTGGDADSQASGSSGKEGDRAEPDDSETEDSETQVAHADLPGRQVEASPAEIASATSTTLMIFGIGLGVAFIGLMAATFFILKAH